MTPIGFTFIEVDRIGEIPLTPAERKKKREDTKFLAVALREEVRGGDWNLIYSVIDALVFLNSELDRRDEALRRIANISTQDSIERRIAREALLGSVDD